MELLELSWGQHGVEEGQVATCNASISFQSASLSPAASLLVQLPDTTPGKAVEDAACT